MLFWEEMSLNMDNRPNILLITADDLNWNSVGAFGCKNPDCTPNIDALSSDAVRFNFGHVTIAACQPNRGALMTGRCPHKSGQEGFHFYKHRPEMPFSVLSFQRIR